MTPEWKDGAPGNLVAAAMDADEWLALFVKMARCGRVRFSDSASLERLEACRDALSSMLAKERP